MTSYVTSALALIDAVRAEHGLPSLKNDTATHVAVMALLSSIASTAAAPVLGAVHGMAMNVTQLLRALVNVALRGCKVIDSKSPDDFVLNNIVNPRFRLLADDLVTVGFSAMVFARGIYSTVAPDHLPVNMQPGHISGASSFNSQPGALGSSIVAGGAYLIASAVCYFMDGELMLGAPAALTLRGAQDRVQKRSLAAVDAFTAPLKGGRGHMSVPVLLGISGGVSALMAAHAHDMNPFVAGLINGGLAGIAFLTIADEWGTKKVRHEMDSKQVQKAFGAAVDSQKDRWKALKQDHDQHQRDRWAKLPLGQWLGDQIVHTAHAVVSGAMVSTYVSSMARDIVGGSTQDWQQTGEDLREWPHALLASAVCFTGGALLVRGMRMLSVDSATPPDRVRQDLLDRELEAGSDRDQSWADGMMPALAGSVVIGAVAAGGGLPIGTAMALGSLNGLVSRLDPLGAAQRAYRSLTGGSAGTAPEPVPMTDIAPGDFKSSSTADRQPTSDG